MFLFFASPLGNAMCAFIYLYLRKTPRCLEGACPKRNTTRDHCRRWGPRLHSVQTVREVKKATRETIPFSWNWTADGVGTLMSTPHNYQQWRNDSTFFEPGSIPPNNTKLAQERIILWIPHSQRPHNEGV